MAVASRRAGRSTDKGGDIGARSLSPGMSDPPEVKDRVRSSGSSMIGHKYTERYRAPPESVNAVLNENWLQRDVGSSSDSGSGSVVIDDDDEKEYLGVARSGRKREEQKGVHTFEKQSAVASGKSRAIAEGEGSWLCGASEKIGEGSLHSPSTSRSRSASPPPPSFQSPRNVQDIITEDGFAAVNAPSAANVPVGESIRVGSVSAASSDASAVTAVVSSMADGVESRPTGSRFGGDGGDEDLGMTRPRTATRRWNRLGPSGDDEDEVIAKTLLSRLTVTSTLSQR